MKIHRYALMIIFAAAVLAGGCSSMIRPESSQPVFYKLDYQFTPVNCSSFFKGGVRIWNFTAVPPYERTQMVVLGTGREVIFSRNYQWTALPGAMLSKNIRNDLEGEKLFSGGLVESGMETAPFELTGQIGKFACRRTNGSCRAVLEVDVTVNRTRTRGEQVFKKKYELKSEPFDKSDSSRFAAAMSKLAGRFSEQLRQDLCAVAGKKGHRRQKAG